MKGTENARRYCGRLIGPAELEHIRDLIRAHPQANRQRLSYLVCEAFDWRKADGGLKDMSARVALLRLHRQGLIALPPPSHKVNPVRAFSRRSAQAGPQALLACGLDELGEVRLEPVDRKGSALWNEYIDRYHYLGYKPLPGAQLRYFAYAGERLVGVFGFGAAAWKTWPRDDYIGWTREQRQRNLAYVVNNARFLILPWVRVRCLASKLLAMAARVLPGHWQARYGYRPVLLESFVESARFTGTCYRAANWLYLGESQGRGKLGDHRLGQVPRKQVWVYPLSRRFRHRLCQ